MHMTRCFILLLAVLGTPALGTDGSAAPDAAEQLTTELIFGGLLDPEAPAQRRAELAASLETRAHERNDPGALYLVGSLYRLGSEASPTSPYPRDPDKAREYLTRAALKGRISAMGKLALLEHEERNRFEANVWAQLQAYYIAERARTKDNEVEKATSAVAGILAVVQEGFPKTDVPKLEERVGTLIRSYDKAIRASFEHTAEQQKRDPLKNARVGDCYVPPLQHGLARRQRYAAGGAEYYVSFADDGNAARIWLIDVWPDARMERALRTCAGRSRVDPGEAIAGNGRIAFLPIALVDRRVKIRSDGS